MATVTAYTEAFFAENTQVGLRSAAVVLPRVLELTEAETVIDVGCAEGAWLSIAKDKGCNVYGVDGYSGGALLGPGEFEQTDLSDGIGCGGYDLAICLEVAEHLPASSAQRLVSGLCGAPWVLFSAAHPGQGGVDHINERWGTYWAGLFAHHGMVGDCALRWELWANREVREFYRENMILFSRNEPVSPVVDVIHPERLGIWP